MKCVHVIGAGLAGLSAAVRLAKAGVKVTIFEAAPHAGGRCRSLSDPVLEAVIDNGRHLMLSGNVEALAYLDLIGAAGEVMTQPRAAFDFFNVQSSARWTVDFGAGQGRLGLLKSLMRKGSRPPGVSAATLLNDMRTLKRAGDREGTGTVEACVGASSAYDVFWRPLAVSVLNTPPEAASAQLLYTVLAETVMKGGAFARPLLTRSGLGAALINPALATLERLGASLRLGTRVKGLDFDGGRVAGLALANGAEVLGLSDAVIVAVPHFAVTQFLTDVTPPIESHAILNVHYRLPEGCTAPPIVGLIGGQAEWVFVRGSIASITVSVADAWMDKDTDAIAHALWPEAARALGLGGDAPTPPFRVIKERRATFAQTPASLALRPGVDSAYENVFLAGDWIETGLPATIEGAVKSGRMAAQAVLAKWGTD